MIHTHLKDSVAVVFLFLISSILPFPAQSQTAPGQTEQIPQPGQLGSPFPAEHSWNHFGLEIGGGYTPVVTEGAVGFDRGFNVTAGVIDHLRPSWAVMAEVQVFGLNGSLTQDSGAGATTETDSNTVVSVGVATAYDLFRHSRTSPYAVGGVGYYRLGPDSGSSSSAEIDAADAVGYNGGIGVRRTLFADRQMQIFAEGRYHYIASGSTAFGQISIFPITAGIRW